MYFLLLVCDSILTHLNARRLTKAGAYFPLLGNSLFCLTAVAPPYHTKLGHYLLIKGK